MSEQVGHFAGKAERHAGRLDRVAAGIVVGAGGSLPGAIHQEAHRTEGVVTDVVPRVVLLTIVQAPNCASWSFSQTKSGSGV